MRKSDDDHCLWNQCLCPPKTHMLKPYHVMVLGGDGVRRWDFGLEFRLEEVMRVEHL